MQRYVALICLSAALVSTFASLSHVLKCQTIHTSTEYMAKTYASQSQHQQQSMQPGTCLDAYLKFGNQFGGHAVVPSAKEGEWALVRIFTREVAYNMKAGAPASNGILVVYMDEVSPNRFRLPSTPTESNTSFLPPSVISAGRLEGSLALLYDAAVEAWVTQVPKKTWEQSAANRFIASEYRNDSNNNVALRHIKIPWEGRIMKLSGSEQIVEIRDCIPADDSVVCVYLEYMQQSSRFGCANWRRTGRTTVRTLNVSRLDFDLLLDYELVEVGQSIEVYNAEARI
jgi:hypothetical protein